MSCMIVVFFSYDTSILTIYLIQLREKVLKINSYVYRSTQPRIRTYPKYWSARTGVLFPWGVLDPVQNIGYFVVAIAGGFAQGIGGGYQPVVVIVAQGQPYINTQNRPLCYLLLIFRTSTILIFQGKQPYYL